MVITRTAFTSYDPSHCSFVSYDCAKMSLPSTHHTLLRLVDANKNSLKCALVKYIDVTVEQQFGQIRNRIVHMIESGEIVLGDVNASNQQFTSNTLPSLVNTVTTELTLIKQECHDSSSSTIPINVHCNDAPNGDDDNQSVHVGIEVKESKNAQVSIDDVKEECDYDDDDDVDEEEGEYMSDCGGCEDYVNGIGGLIGRNDDAHNDAHTEVDMQSGLGQNEIEDKQSASLECDLMVISNVIDASNQSTDNANDLSLINECDQQIRSNQNSIKQNVGNGQSVQPLVDNQQSIPSSSGLRLSSRNRIQRKLFGVDQSSGEVKCDKRKCNGNSMKAVKKVKKPNIEEIDQDEEEGKLQVITLKVHCTEDGCKTFLNSLEIWKTHLSSVHSQMPYKHILDNVRHNQHGQTEYACTECKVVSKSQRSLIQHWRMYHLSGKFECSICAFVGNLWCEVHNHYRKNHRPNTIQCTQEGCNQTFQFMNHLEIHQRIHSGETPYRCTWDNCGMTFNLSTNAIRHVRMKHFHLPRTVKKQKELNIVDERDPKMYVQVSRE